MRTPAAWAAAAREARGCRVVGLGSFGGESTARFACADGWASARLLLALSRQSARDPRVVRMARAIRRLAAGDDETAARVIHAYVRDRVEFIRENVETFSGAGWLLDEIARRGRAQGDCDCQAQLVYALGAAAGLRPTMIVLAGGGDGEPRHVLCKLNGAWAETTIAADFGEHPIGAVMRLGVKSRPDLLAARETTLGELGATTMTNAYTSDLSDADFDALAREFSAEGLDPHVALDVMFSESDFRASRRNASGAAYGGLNQMGTRELAGYGLTLDDWLAMPASAQIPVVRKFWHARRESLAASKGPAMRELLYRDAAHLYAANFWPAGLRPIDATDYPIVTREANPVAYAWNKGLDVNGDGEISIDDMAAWLEKRKAQEPHRYGELVARLDAAIARGGGALPGMGPAILSGLIVGAALALAHAQLT